MELEEKKVEYVPKCHECGSIMKPNVKFFDDYYTENFYKSVTVERFVAEADCLIVVGSDTYDSTSHVRSFLQKKLPVIEINEESTTSNESKFRV